MRNTLLSFFLFLSVLCCAAIVPVGSGSYTTTYPGADAAGRNGYPNFTPQLSGVAATKPIPTNDWWSLLLKDNHVSNLFNYPYTMRTMPQGLVVSYIPQGVIDDLLPITVGVTGLSSTQCTVSDHSDWTVTMRWDDGVHQMEAVSGVGMPFLYFTKQSADVAQVAITSGIVTVQAEMIVVENAKHGASFAIYAPVGSTWTNTAGVYTSTLNGQNYWSVAMLPQGATNVATVANEYKQYAYVFPTNTTANYNYNATTGVVRTDFTVTTVVKEGTNQHMLLGLLPHQWAHLASNSAQPQGYSYNTIRGELKTLSGNSFSVENRYYGILPTLPHVGSSSPSFVLDTLNSKINAIKDDAIGTWTDSYNDGQLLNRLIQTARVAAEVGNTAALNTMLNTIQDRLENWLSYSQGEVAFLFYYHSTWSALLGYPAGHGQDNNLNDHHFHWGYFIHAAAFMEQYRPGWAAQWGDMVNLLVRDAASYDRNDTMFPYLRSFSPYAGHCWANGFATFPNGNDQESTSESMQFNSALIHWGTITGNNAIRDLGIYLYTTEQSAIEEYWLDVHRRNFPTTQQYALISRLWGNNLDNQTFWTGDIAASYGIELYPIHGGSLYLGHNKAYAARLWNEIKQNTGITSNEANVNLWHDVMWEYGAFTNQGEVLAMYDSYPNRDIKFGVSDAQTYYWLHSMNVLGAVEATISADYPIAAVFNKNGRITYTAHNYGTTARTVTFSDGYLLQVPANTLVAQSVGEMVPSVAITSPKHNEKVLLGEAVTVTAEVMDFSTGVITEVLFYANGNVIGAATTAPYSVQWQAAEGTYQLTARATNSEGAVGMSEPITVVVTGDNSCSVTANEASQGSFSSGYKLSFETIGTNVNVTAELLDTDKDGVVAYLWLEMPFSERQMGGNTAQFTSTLTGQTVGQELSIAVKFAYAGGMSVTKYYPYVVGNNCEPDVETGLDQLELSGVNCFPNPVVDVVTFQSSSEMQRLELRNLLGHTVKVLTLAESKVECSLSGLPSGHYLAIVTLENGEVVLQKLVKL